MNQVMRILSLLALVAGATGVGAEELEEFNVENLPREEILLHTGRKTYNVRYQNRNWRETTVEELLARNLLESQEICFEAKFDSVNRNEVKLFGQKGRIICRDESKLRYMGNLARGDNVWMCGMLRPVPDSKGSELVLVDVRRLPKDLQRIENRLNLLIKTKDAQGLIELGHKINSLLNDNLTDFNQHDKFVTMRTRAWFTALSQMEKDLDPKDADATFELAQKWFELLRKTHKYHELVRQTLRIDPDHPRAKTVAVDKLGMIKYLGRWMTKEEKEQSLTQEKERQEHLDAQKREQMEERERQRRLAEDERVAALVQIQTALRTDDLGALEGAVKTLAEKIKTSPDPGFGRRGVDILASIPDPSAVWPGLDLATRSEYEVVRRDAMEALAWRRNETALNTLADALRRETDIPTARSGVEAVVRLGGPPALKTLVASLDTENDRVQAEVLEGLKTLTGRNLEDAKSWKQWWEANRDKPDQALTP